MHRRPLHCHQPGATLALQDCTSKAMCYTLSHSDCLHFQSVLANSDCRFIHSRITRACETVTCPETITWKQLYLIPDEKCCVQIKKAARTTIVSTQSKPGIKDNVAAIFGAKLASSLETLAASNDTFAISGVISSAVKVGGKTNGHPQFLFLNSRPVDIPKFVRVVNDAYRCVHATCHATQLVQFNLPP